MSRWEKFCVVGIGGHARTKLIPAIEANGQTIVGLVSRQPSTALPDAPIFATLEAAVPVLPDDTVIVIASPPLIHFSQTRTAIEGGFDVIVEKPAFVTAKEAKQIAALCTARGTVLVEAFMQRHSALYRRLIDYCMAHRVAAIDLAFVIPAMPTGTFRSESDPGSSSLYDIGCYILALLSDLGLDLHGLDITRVRHPGTMHEAVELA
ncbi:Gfo/Idh/MocA family oxidoreductase, partial [Sphingomonas sp.]|uniref:Gfo/Idh/MocA family protein n=1 Tax=Sphingomonas sp. TaxID=28214 RepID=UPI001EC03B89